MITEFSELIDELDKTLSSVARLWLDPESFSRKDEIMEAIDKTLDRRLSLMEKRDGTKKPMTFLGMPIIDCNDPQLNKDPEIKFGDFNDYKNWPDMDHEGR